MYGFFVDGWMDGSRIEMQIEMCIVGRMVVWMQMKGCSSSSSINCCIIKAKMYLLMLTQQDEYIIFSSSSLY
jgi:hypothetical protein